MDYILTPLRPMTRIEAIVFTRTAAGPFSCRINSRGKDKGEHITVLDVQMPDRTDLAGEPLLRSMTPGMYHRLLDAEEARVPCRTKLQEFEYILQHGSIDQLIELKFQLEQINL